MKRIMTPLCALLVCALIGFGALKIWIHVDVTANVALAREAFPAARDDLTALLALVHSPDHSLRERNSAVWTLGQRGYEKALPALEALYTGEPCDHENALCQYGVAKAINLCGGDVEPKKAQCPR